LPGFLRRCWARPSAALNALATSFIRDFYQPYINRTAGDARAVRAARMATAVFGLSVLFPTRRPDGEEIKAAS